MTDQDQANGAEQGADKGGRARYVLSAVFDVDFVGGPRDDVREHRTSALREAVESYSRGNVSGTTLVHVSVGRALR